MLQGVLLSETVIKMIEHGFWFVCSLFGLFLLLRCLYSHNIGFEILCGAMVITMLWSCVVHCSLVMTWAFLYLFLLIGVENLGELWRLVVRVGLQHIGLHDFDIFLDVPWYYMILVTLLCDAIGRSLYLLIIFRFGIIYAVGVPICVCSFYDIFCTWSLWLHVMGCICW